MWKESKQIQKKLKIKTDEKTLNKIFAERVQSLVINSYVSVITQLYAWQLPSDLFKTLLLLQEAKLSALLNNIYCDEDQI